MRLTDHWHDPIARLLILSPALLYLGLGFGLPLLLSHLPHSAAPNTALAALGGAMLLASVVVPPVLLCRASWQLRRKWLLCAVLSVLLWPVGTFLVGLSLWDKRPRADGEKPAA